MLGSTPDRDCKLSRVENLPLSPANSREIPQSSNLGKQIDPAQTRTYAEQIQYPCGSHATVALEMTVTEWTDGAQTRQARLGLPICYHSSNDTPNGFDFGHFYCRHIAILAGRNDDPDIIISNASAGRPLDHGFMVAYDAASSGDLPGLGTAASAAVVADWASVNMRESVCDSGLDYERGVSDDRQSAEWREANGW